METEATNKSVIDRTLGEKLGRILGELRPEAAYFGNESGKRTGFIVLDMPEAYMMPKLAEPFFLAFDAEVDWYPVMSREDLAKALHPVTAHPSPTAPPCGDGIVLGVSMGLGL